MSLQEKKDFEATRPLSEYVDASLKRYFAELNGHKPSELYQLFLSQVEKPLFQSVLEHCNGNNSQAADMLGINRATLRKKVELYKIKR